jgi:protein-S-isoprenylcysteine O-methyltransferase Ste14
MVSSPAPVVASLLRPYAANHVIGVLWLVAFVAYGTIEFAGALRSRAEATRKDRGSFLVLQICIIPGAILMVLAPSIAPGAEIHLPLVAAIVGLAIFVSGESIRVWAKVALGRYFTYTVMTSSDQPVITSGPYRFVRHPSYTGILLITIGISVGWGNWLGVAGLTAAAAVALIYRIRVEERALLDDLGDRYRTYAMHRKRLIPLVW